MVSPLRRIAPHQTRTLTGKPKALRWQVPDLIDFDYYVGEDEQRVREKPAERKQLAERDRKLYKEQIAPIIGEADAHSSKHRNRALRWWLELRRRQEDLALAELLPGQAFARAQRLVTSVMGITGFGIGIGVASTLLQYEGDHPVNVSWYLFWLVLLQLILVATTLGLWYGRRSRLVKGATQDISLLGQSLRPLFSGAARWVQKQRLAHVPPELRERAKAKQGLIQANYALYGPASYLPVLVPAQVFGIGFNLGAILMTMALIWFADLGFGWGSAMNIRPETIQGLTQLIALPWSWLFGEGVGVPSLEQIAGTRISLKDPLYVLDADHLRSWRWFLVLAVITYGLLPRIALLGLSVYKQRRSLAALPFTHQNAQAPYARMITPSLETGIAVAGDRGSEMPIPSPLKPLTRPSAAPRPPKPSPTPPSSEPRMPPAEPTGALGQRPGPSGTESGSAPTAADGKTTGRDSTDITAQPKLPAAASGRGTSPEARAETPSQQPPSPPAAQATPRGTEARPDALSSTRPAEAPTQTAAIAPGTSPSSSTNSTAGAQASAREAASAHDAPAADTRAQDAEVQSVEVEADACILLLHIDVSDLLEDSDHSRLQALLHQQAGWRVAAAATYGGGRAMADQAIELIDAATWQAPPPRVALVQDGSQPPITENLRFLRAVRAAAGEQAQVLLALIGDPDDDVNDPLPPLSQFDFADWQRKIEQMGDPYLRLVMLAPADDEAL